MLTVTGFKYANHVAFIASAHSFFQDGSSEWDKESLTPSTPSSFTAAYELLANSAVYF
jgi:hypothetical protein